MVIKHVVLEKPRNVCIIFLLVAISKPSFAGDFPSSMFDCRRVTIGSEKQYVLSRGSRDVPMLPNKVRLRCEQGSLKMQPNCSEPIGSTRRNKWPVYLGAAPITQQSLLMFIDPGLTIIIKHPLESAMGVLVCVYIQI